MTNETRLRGILALLLVTTAVLFAIGTTIERSQRNNHVEAASIEKTAGTSSEGSTSKTEAGGETNGEKQGTTAEAAGTAETHVESTEKLFGIDTESVAATAAAVAVSLILAAAVWWRRERWWLWITLGFGAIFALGDIRELIHQLNESRTGVAIIAAILITAHLLVAVISGLLLRDTARRAVAPAAVEQPN